jgi:hypothetical protein
MFRINHPIAVNITNKCGLVKGYTNVLKIDLKCPEKYIKAYIMARHSDRWAGQFLFLMNGCNYINK